MFWKDSVQVYLDVSRCTTDSCSNIIQQFLPDVMEPWGCCFQDKFELCSGGRSILGTATPTLVPHSSLKSCPKSCWCPLFLDCFLSTLLCCHCSALLYLHVPTAPCDCGARLQTHLSPSNVGGTACDNPALPAPVRAAVGNGGEAAGDLQVEGRVEVGGTQLSDTAVCSSLWGGAGSVHDNHHIFWRVVPVPMERDNVLVLLLALDFPASEIQ